MIRPPSLKPDDETAGTHADTGHAEMSEYQDGTSPEANRRPDTAMAGPGLLRACRSRSPGYYGRWDDGQRMLAVTAERLATDADRAETTGYLATIPVDSELRCFD